MTIKMLDGRTFVEVAVQTEYSATMPGQGRRYGSIQKKNQPSNSYASASGSKHSSKPTRGIELRPARTASLPIPSLHPSLTELITAALARECDPTATPGMRSVTMPDSMYPALAQYRTSDVPRSPSPQNLLDSSKGTIVIHDSFEGHSPPSSPDSIVLVGGFTSVPQSFRSIPPLPNSPSSDQKSDKSANLGGARASWEHSPPRPIPALHGPLSLPYARCPSGAEGVVFDRQETAQRLVWGLHTLEEINIVPEQLLTPHSPSMTRSDRRNTVPHPTQRDLLADVHNSLEKATKPCHGLGFLPPRRIGKKDQLERTPFEPIAEETESLDERSYLGRVTEEHISRKYRTTPDRRSGLGAANLLNVLETPIINTAIRPPHNHRREQLPTPPNPPSPLWTSLPSYNTLSPSAIDSSREIYYQHYQGCKTRGNGLLAPDDSDRFRQFWAETQNLDPETVQSRISMAYDALLPPSASKTSHAYDSHPLAPQMPLDTPWTVVVTPSVPLLKHNRSSPEIQNPQQLYPRRPLQSSHQFPNLIPRSKSDSTSQLKSVPWVDEIAPTGRRTSYSSSLRNPKSIPLARLVDRQSQNDAANDVDPIPEDFEAPPSTSCQFFQMPDRMTAIFQRLNLSDENLPASFAPQTRDNQDDVEGPPHVRLPGVGRTATVQAQQDTSVNNVTNPALRKGVKHVVFQKRRKTGVPVPIVVA